MQGISQLLIINPNHEWQEIPLTQIWLVNGKGGAHWNNGFSFEILIQLDYLVNAEKLVDGCGREMVIRSRIILLAVI